MIVGLGRLGVMYKFSKLHQYAVHELLPAATESVAYIADTFDGQTTEGVRGRVEMLIAREERGGRNRSKHPHICGYPAKWVHIHVHIYTYTHEYACACIHL